MSYCKLPIVFIVMMVGACSTSLSGSGTTDPRIIKKLPDEVTKIAAKSQDLKAVRLQDDGCYWYRYEGPVETTFLPLLASQGRPICVRKVEA